MPDGRGRLTLVLPGYASGVDAVAGAGVTPTLQRLLARAQWTDDTRSTGESLLEVFGIAAASSLAALLARVDLGRSDDGWLRADPVHYIADARRVMLMAPKSDDVTTAEADAFLDELRARLPEFTWQRGGDARRWYARMPLVDATPALGPAWLHGRSLTPFFPQDPAHRRWRQTMTETQMVMHDAAVNRAREARGALPLNALWIWGAGCTPTVTPTRCVLAIGDDPLLHGAAMTVGVTCVEAAAASAVAAALARGEVVVVAGAPFDARDDARADVITAANAFAGLAWQMLGAGDIDTIELVGERLRGRVTRAARWRWWRTRAPGVFDDPHAVRTVP